jgi:nucleotide-binding universal stress UspA family protein
MSIRNILVSLEPLSPATSALACAIALAERLGASVSAFAVARPWGEPSYTGLGPAAGALIEQQRVEIEEALELLEEQFRSNVAPAMQGRFNGFIDTPTDRLIEAAVTADLIMLPPAGRGPSNLAVHVDPGRVVLAAGRPVLMLAEGTRPLPLRHVLVAWKDTREARRSVSDAMPLLQLAEHVDVMCVDEGDYGRERAELDSVADWLRAHKVKVAQDVLPPRGTVAETIADFATQSSCDLVVSGGYGRTRLREWLFGGVTRELLGAPGLNRMMSN